MKRSLNRRGFLAGSGSLALLAGGFYVNPARSADTRSPNEKLNLAFVGVANKGWHNVQQLTSENVVALCDVDSDFLDKAAKSFPKAARYRDYRRLLDGSHQEIDAVVVSTADHSHAPATSIALDLGKHTYCEKPLTHTVQEARAISRLAAKRKVATQMGTQIHASNNYRRVVETIAGGAIGPVAEVHCWCNKGWSGGKFESGQSAPANLDWDLWLGPAKERPYSPGIHPFNWRRFWDFGSGTLGDMGCHVLDLPFWALGLRHPETIRAEGPEPDAVGTPAWNKIEYRFAAQGAQPAVRLLWSDGGKHSELVDETKAHDGKPLAKWGLGVLFVGERGMLAADYGRLQLLPQDQFADFQPPQPTIADSVGHWNEWVAACKTSSPTSCNFDYASALTATVLLGTVAF
ncbi:MAG TPA: Gfo/Idh/MocA family oxidoreductase, partial [Pirellulales bacterium]|nr:Gfo/Idh/MocA family oxidoreductase [Pirellulales bacterium]